MTTLRLCLICAAVALLVGLTAGFTGAWAIYRPKSSAVASDQPHAAQKTPAGLLIQEQPKAHLPQPMGLPRGARVVRTTHLEILPAIPPARELPKPPGPTTPQGEALPEGYSAEPVKIDLSFVRMPDGHLRTLVKAEDGQILKAVDVPDSEVPIVAPAPVRQAKGWALGGFINPATKAWGPVVMKDLGPFRFAAEGRIEKVSIPGGGTVHNDGVDLIVAVTF